MTTGCYVPTDTVALSDGDRARDEEEITDAYALRHAADRDGAIERVSQDGGLAQNDVIGRSGTGCL